MAATWVRVLRRTIVRGEARDPDWEGWCPEGELDVLVGAGYVEEATPPGQEPEPEPEPEPETEAEAETTETAADEEATADAEADDEGEADAEAEEDEDAAADDEEAEPETDVPEWPLTMQEAEYLERFPDGQHADAARARIEAGAAEANEDAGDD